MRPALTLALSACLAPTLGPGPALAAPDAGALAAAAGLSPGADGRVVNACASAVTPSLSEIALGGAAGTAYLLVIPGGDETPGCYGDVPGDMYLLVADGPGFRPVFSGGGYIMVLPTRHEGVQDFALVGPGFSFPVFVWNGSAFSEGGTIADGELSALGDLPTYP